MLEPIKDSVIFKFDSDVTHGRFIEQSDSGIYLGKDHTRDANAPRWGTVVLVGPDVSDVNIGDRILIEPTQWTFRTEFEGQSLWRTVESKILCTEGE